MVFVVALNVEGDTTQLTLPRAPDPFGRALVPRIVTIGAVMGLDALPARAFARLLGQVTTGSQRTLGRPPLLACGSLIGVHVEPAALPVAIHRDPRPPRS